MSFSNDFSSDFDDGKPRLGDKITVVLYMPGNQTTTKFSGVISSFVGLDHGDATRLTTDIPQFDGLEVPLGCVMSNPTYKWVAEYTIAPKQQ